MIESAIQLTWPDIDSTSINISGASVCAREVPQARLPFTEHMVNVDKCHHLEFVLELYIKALSFRGGLLVKSKHCLCNSTKDVTLWQYLTQYPNHAPKQDAHFISCHQACSPSAFSVPVLMTTIAQAPRQNLQVILHTLDPPTGFINSIPK